MPPGRKCRLNAEPELQAQIMEFVRAGVHPERAAMAAGVSERAHYLWQAQGLEEREHRDAGKTPRKTWQVYLDYVDALDRAVAQAEAALVISVSSASEGWQANLAVLERRFKDRWSNKIPPAAKGGGAVATGAPVQQTGLDMLSQRRQARRVKKTS